MIGFCSSPRFVEHVPGPDHPERPDRIRAINAAIQQAGLIAPEAIVDPPGDFSIDLNLRPQPAPILISLEPILAAREQLEAVHPPAYVEHILHTCAMGGGVLDQGDTVVGPSSFEVAQLSAGAVMRCCDAIMGRGDDVQMLPRAFAAVRPPGHHAEPDRAMGFCLFANVAIGARYLQRHHGIGRIAIVDFDVHHGNGTQAIFDDDPSVFFVSLHQNPSTLWPGSGFAYETGNGAGAGYTLNVPFDPGAGDDEYLHAMASQVVPALDRFAPEVLMISAGFDGHRDDGMSDIQLTEEGFAQITRCLVDVARRHCNGRIVSVLEGGYNLRALGRSVVQHLLALHEP